MRISEDIYLVGSGKLGFDWTDGADCNIYLIHTGAGALLIDSGAGQSVDQICRNITDHGFALHDISHILLTHLHADHSGGAAELKRRTGAKLALLDEAAAVLEAGDEAGIDLPRAVEAGFYPGNYRWNPCSAELLLHSGDTLRIGGYAFRVLHTPGHSAYDTCFYMEGRGREPVLISGDTVMYGGRISMLNTHDFRLDKLAASMGLLAGLEPEILLPGHGQPALSRAAEHVRRAHHIFSSLGIPQNIG
ncbi:MBL fold metallo-hydrolase [Paenibacillus sp. S150]|uniref:MBL fold metallo-hydrolase n=1 Tax=Paenibacillus sp. S150 TaxID=2749826 RepID=UPI001C56DC73|nr:MBL fold metallo-hydrolase [Paenibacillus sp. S150]MBW4084263.1 MBL fold metallo-hydrolase [Paenibacillus sp. S150]